MGVVWRGGVHIGCSPQATEDLVCGVLAVGCFLLSNIINMDQTPLPWEYLEGKTYEFNGKKTVWVKSKKSGWGKQQTTIQLTVFANGVSHVLPLLVFRSIVDGKSTHRR